MGLVKCPDCGRMVSERAAACPSCGCPADAFERPSDGFEGDSGAAYDPDYGYQIARALAQPLCRFYDRADLMLANRCVMNDLQNNVSAGRNITFITNDSAEIIKKVARSEFVFPYVLVTADYRYITDYRKFTLVNPDGKSYQRYYDLKTLPCQYAPQIEVISDSADEANEIVEAIKRFFKEPKTYSVPFLGSPKDSLTFTCEIKSVEKTNDITDARRLLYINKTVKFKPSQWAAYIDEEANPNQNRMMDTFRKVQLAQFYLLYSDSKSEYESQLTLYERLFLYVSAIRGAFGPWQTDEYKILRNKLQAGQPFDADLVDKAFPDLSLIYHDLPNDIKEKTPVANVRKRVNGILNQYKTLWEKTCIDLNLPEDFTIMGRDVCVRDDYGLGWILNALEQDITRTIDDIIDEIRVKATEAAIELDQQEQMEAEQQIYQYESRDRSPGVLTSILTTATGVALGNNISQKGKQNYMGSPNCERAKTGRHSSCWGCGLGDYCTMHDKY